MSTSSVTSSGSPYVNGLLSGVKWSAKDLSFSFPQLGSYYNGYSSTYSSLPRDFIELYDNQKAFVRQSLKAYEQFSLLKFTEIAEASENHAVLRFANTIQANSKNTASGFYPATSAMGGDVWFSLNDRSRYTSPAIGNYEGTTFLHEIGHALGLKHPHESAYFGSMPVGNYNIGGDSLEYTVMSYRDYLGLSVGGAYIARDYPQSLMMFDIAAIQHMYGANFGATSNNTDTVYTFSTLTGEMLINGQPAGRSQYNIMFRTIWDGGGIDTYDFSNYTSHARIDLNPGGWVDVDTNSNFQTANLSYYRSSTLEADHYAVGNIANALLYKGNTASLIENAKGGSGNDLFLPNQAANFLDGGAGVDTVSYELAKAGVIVELLPTGWQSSGLTASNGGAAVGDSFVRIENLTGTDYADTLRGNSLDNVLTGRSGNDRLDGSAGGTDTLAGDAGNDTITASVGDRVDGGANTDTLYLDLQSSSLAFKLDITAGGNGEIGGGTSVLRVEQLFYTGGLGTDEVTGAGLADTLNGGGGGDTLRGSGGIDTLIGGTGANLMDGGAGNDTITSGVYGSSSVDAVIGGAGTDLLFINRLATTIVTILNLSNPSVVAQTGNGGTIVGIERLDFRGGYGNDNVIATASNDFLSGDKGNDTLSGGGGVDWLDGGTNTNALLGGAGDDFINSWGIDRIDGGTGIDELRLYRTQSTVDLTLTLAAGGGGVNIGDGSLVTLVEKLVFYGGSGNDRVTGGAYADLLWGEDGVDSLSGAAGVDYLSGGSNNDYLDGGLGNDQMLGGTGDDTFVVNSASDTVIEDVNEGSDTIRTTVSFDLMKALNVENLWFTGSAVFVGKGNTLNNSISGGNSRDTLSGLDGNDMLLGGGGGDTLSGGVGGDRFVYAATGDSGLTSTTMDVIKDFAVGDIIDVSAIDAIAGGGDDWFIFIGTAAFSEPGQIRAIQSGADTILHFSTDADATAEMAIRLTAFTASTLSSLAFIL